MLKETSERIVRHYLLVGLGGFLGANLRFWLATRVAARFGTAFPYGTLIINVSGSFLIGLILAYLLRHPSRSDAYRLFLTVGFLGGYTTFSSFAFESLSLIQRDASMLALINLVGSVLLGLAAVTIGYTLGHAI
ncbi:MAG: fluoride efflux transporter CrcB [Dehalococcoidia bacterium]